MFDLLIVMVIVPCSSLIYISVTVLCAATVPLVLVLGALEYLVNLMVIISQL